MYRIIIWENGKYREKECKSGDFLTATIRLLENKGIEYHVQSNGVRCEAQSVVYGDVEVGKQRRSGESEGGVGDKGELK